MHECEEAVGICDQFEDSADNQEDIDDLHVFIVLDVEFYPVYEKDIAKQDEGDLDLGRP